jgi:transposase
VSNVLNEEKKQQAVALGRLGWSLRQIQKAIGVRRETISVYLKAAGVAMRAPRGQIIPAKPASQSKVITEVFEAEVILVEKRTTL